jgi:thiol:disulfide interchange protein DsbG
MKNSDRVSNLSICGFFTNDPIRPIESIPFQRKSRPHSSFFFFLFRRLACSTTHPFLLPMKSKHPIQHRATLHPLSVLIDSSRRQGDESMALWARGAVRITESTAQERMRLQQERQRMEQQQKWMRRGMTAVMVLACLMWGARAFAQGTEGTSGVRVVAKTSKSTDQKTTSSKKTVTGPASVMVEAAKQGHYPAVIASMIAKGKNVSVLDVFEATGGLVGFVVIADGSQSRIYYVTQDGGTAIYGLAFDASLNNLTSKHLASFTNPLRPKASVGTLAPVESPANAATSAPAPVTSKKDAKSLEEDLWSLPSGAKPAGSVTPAAPQKADMGVPLNMAMKARGAFVEGRGLPVYIVFDPACPYCHKTHRDTRQLLGQLEIHWIPVGALGPRSILLAETFLRSKNKAQAMELAMNNELKPADFSTPEVNQLHNENASILSAANVSNVPLILFSEKGVARHMLGAPNAAQLKELIRVASSAR